MICAITDTARSQVNDILNYSSLSSSKHLVEYARTKKRDREDIS